MHRQRKLTWIEKKQIEKTAFDHPFFDVPGTVLSKKEAEAVIRSAEARKSGTEIVFEACDKANIPRPDCVDDHYSVSEGFKEVFAVPAIRRIGIIAIALILLVAFFAATPIGRAIAESVIRYIGILFDDGIVTVNRSDNEVTMIPLDSVPDSGENVVQENTDLDIYMNSFEEFTTATGVQPVVLPFQHTELHYYHDKYSGLLDLKAVYKTSNGKISTYQIWNAPDLASISSTGFTVYAADPSVYFSVEENGEITVIKIYEDSIMSIYTEGIFSVDNIISLIVND